MKPSWKTYDIECWDHVVAGCSPRPGFQPGGPFRWNECGICTNPHVFGVYSRNWRIGILTAQNKRGRWVAGEDVSFITAGYIFGPLNVDAHSFPEEWGARALSLRRIALWVERNANSDVISCPIPASQAREALRLISQAIEDIEPKRIPTYTQLSLF